MFQMAFATVLADVWLNHYEGEDDTVPGGGGDDDLPPEIKDPNGKFTPEQQATINKILATEKRKYKDSAKKQADALKQTLESKNLTEKQRQALEKQYEDLRSQYMTAEQKAAEERDKLTNQYKSELGNVSNERDLWKTRYTDSTIARSIVDAAIQHDAYDPEQLTALLRGNTRLVEALDGSGKPSGNLVPKVKWKDKDKEGKDVELDLDPSEVVKKMTEIDRYKNLFKTKAAGGLNGDSGSGSSQSPVDISKMTPEQYRKWRKEAGLARK